VRPKGAENLRENVHYHLHRDKFEAIELRPCHLGYQPLRSATSD
jgi:hypothetical protein